MPHSSGGGSHSGGSSGGFSGGSSHSSGGSGRSHHVYNTYHPGTHRYVYYSHGKPKYYYSNSKVTSPLAGIIFLFGVVVIWLYATFPAVKAMCHIPRKVSLDYDTQIIIEDNIDVLSDREEIRLMNVFEDFQDNTGITPALITVDNTEWKEYYYTLSQYAYDLYVNRFSDEKHWLLIYSTNSTDVILTSFDEYVSHEDFDDWYWEGMQGDDTDSILDTQYTSQFNEVVQKQLMARSKYSIADAFINGFISISPKIMKFSMSKGALLFIIIFIGFPVGYFGGLAISLIGDVKKSKALRCPTDEEKPQEDSCEYCEGIYVHGIHESCPHCGAPIKKWTELNACPYCKKIGDKITVKSRYRNGTPNRRMYWIECGYCGTAQRHDDNSGFRTRERAIQAWNNANAHLNIR